LHNKTAAHDFITGKAFTVSRLDNPDNDIVMLANPTSRRHRMSKLNAKS